jgi:hypothetical protein
MLAQQSMSKYVMINLGGTAVLCVQTEKFIIHENNPRWWRKLRSPKRRIRILFSYKRSPHTLLHHDDFNLQMFEIRYSDILTFISFFSYTQTCLVLTTTSPDFINFNVYSFHVSTQWLKLKPSIIKMLFCIKSYAMNFNNIHFLTNCSIWYVSLVLVGVILRDSNTRWFKYDRG